MIGRTRSQSQFAEVCWRFDSATGKVTSSLRYRQAAQHSIPRVLPVTFLRGDERISYFSLVTTVGTPQTVTAVELRLECMFPMTPPAPRPKGKR